VNFMCVPRCVQECPSSARGHGGARGRCLSLAEEKGFEPLVELPPRRFSKPSQSGEAAQGWDGMGTLGELAVQLLRRMLDGTCTSGDVARLAADVLANPPPVMAAAQRYLREVGGQHEGAAAVELLGLLAGAAVSGQSVRGRSFVNDPYASSPKVSGRRSNARLTRRER
jgi:hypothetical protein